MFLCARGWFALQILHDLTCFFVLFLQDLFGCSYQPVPGTVPVDSCPNDLCVLLVHFLLNIALGMGCSCTENGNRLAQYHEEE